MAPGSRTHTNSRDIIAICDIIWHASTHPVAPLSVQTLYTGSRILFKKELVPTNSPSVARCQYHAVLKFEGQQTIYGCDEKLFQNFDILSLPPPSTFHLSPLPLSSTSPDYITLSTSPSASQRQNQNQYQNQTEPGLLILKFISMKDDEGYPFLHFQLQEATEILDDQGGNLQMCAVGWAKRREFDDEVPTGTNTCLSEGERLRLGGRREIDMDSLEREGDGLEEGEVRE